MSQTSQAVEMRFTELRISGSGTVEATPLVFKFTSPEHATPIGDLNLHLQTKTVRKEIPGSNKVVEQSLATTWQPFEIAGEWSDSWGNRRSSELGTPERTGAYAFSMVQRFAQFVGRQPLVRWEFDAWSFVGILTDFKIAYKRKGRIGWMITISPHENETIRPRRPVVRKNVQSIPKWMQDARDKGTVLTSSYDSQLRALDLKTDLVSEFKQNALLGINDALDRLQAIDASTFTSDPVNKLLLVASTFRRLRGACLQGQLALSRITSSETIAFDDALQTVGFSEWSHTSIYTLWQMIKIARDGELDCRRRARQRPKALYYPRQGESLERISAQFYGTPNNWRAIYDRNNLSSLVLDGTEELIIPEMAT